MLDETQRDAEVVLVDDVVANLRLLESSLRAFGMRRIRIFSDSATALDWLSHNDWHLLLLDLDMPAPDGFEILQHLTGRDRSRQPVIILTALSDVENRRRGYELGANDYLCKPLDLPELLLRMRNNLGLSLATRALQHQRDHLESAVEERTAQLSASYAGVVRCLSRAAEYKDNETGNHILRIGESAALLARLQGASEEWVELIHMAAPMHDVGKIGIPDHILNKPGRLTPEEREVMNRHSALGHAILDDANPTPLTQLAAEIALCHHERWDGTGYPQGLAGEAIPLSARIVALCDVYDALRSVRPYKKPWDMASAADYIREHAGSQFDPKLAALMCEHLDEIEALRLELADDSGLQGLQKHA